MITVCPLKLSIVTHAAPGFSEAPLCVPGCIRVGAYGCSSSSWTSLPTHALPCGILPATVLASAKRISPTISHLHLAACVHETWNLEGLQINHL